MGASTVAKKNGQLLNNPSPTMTQDTEYITCAVVIIRLSMFEPNLFNAIIATTIIAVKYAIVVWARIILIYRSAGPA